MKVFIAYAFSDKWVPDLMIPLIESLGFTVETGRELAGQQIDEGVKGKIQDCDGLVAFFTMTDLGHKPSDWVIQEDTYADSLGMRVLEVREKGVDFKGGLAGNRQHILMDALDRLPASVELCKALSEWRSGLDIEIRLRTQEFVDAVRPRLSGKRYRCMYVLRHRDGREIARMSNAEILPRTGGLFVYARNVAKESFIEFRIELGDEVWTSPGREVQTIDVDLEKE